jgi:hypothetical protein
MKIVLQIFFILLPFLFFSCVEKKNNRVQIDETLYNQDVSIHDKEKNIDNSINQIIATNEEIKLKEYYKLDNDSEYDIIFEIEKDGVYIIDKMYNLEFIINGNNTFERIYDDLLFFINTNWYTWSLYNYKTKEYIEIKREIGLIKYISDDEVEITNGDDIIILNFAHDEEIGKILEFSYSGDTGTEEADLFYYSMYENYNKQEDTFYDVHKLKLFDKKICIDTKHYVELSYDKRHNVFILCVYSSKGR